MPSPTDITYKKFGDVDELKVLQCLKTQLLIDEQLAPLKALNLARPQSG